MFSRSTWLLLIVIALTSCTAAPMVALMGYDTLGKRQRWTEYANEGDTYAQYELAQSYCCRAREGPLDAKRALKWWCVAGKNGYSKAQVQLGKLYENLEVINGITVQRDFTIAYMWYELARRRGDEDGRENYMRLKNQLNSRTISDAEAMLKNWKAVPCGVGL